jgi:hypothetical protein
LNPEQAERALLAMLNIAVGQVFRRAEENLVPRLSTAAAAQAGARPDEVVVEAPAYVVVPRSNEPSERKFA